MNSATPKNEPVKEYRPHSPETTELKEHLTRLMADSVEIPLLINGKEVRTGKTESCHPPHLKAHALGRYHKAGTTEVQAAISGALAAYSDWSRMAPRDRAQIFLKAAELLATKYRPILNAATMLGQSKTCHQAEIDSACELIDFWRFNVHFQEELHRIQPLSPRACGINWSTGPSRGLSSL